MRRSWSRQQLKILPQYLTISRQPRPISSPGDVMALTFAPGADRIEFERDVDSAGWGPPLAHPHSESSDRASSIRLLDREGQRLSSSWVALVASPIRGRCSKIFQVATPSLNFQTPGPRPSREARARCRRGGGPSSSRSSRRMVSGQSLYQLASLIPSWTGSRSRKDSKPHRLSRASST